MRVNGSPLRPGPPPGPSSAPPGEGGTSSPLHLRQRTASAGGNPGLPGYAVIARDSLESAATMTTQDSSQLFSIPIGSNALEVEGPRPPSPNPARPWWRCCWPWCRDPIATERAQTWNARGWQGHFIRWMPLAGAIIGSISLYFAVRNYRLIYAQRTFALLRRTGPTLVKAHNDILEGLIKIQQQLNITNVSTLEPPLPPDPSVHSLMDPPLR